MALGTAGLVAGGTPSSSRASYFHVWAREHLRDLTAAVVLLLGCAYAPAAAQRAARLATTADALLDAPLFFHGRQIAVHGQVAGAGGHTRLLVAVDEADVGRRNLPQVFVFWKDTPSDTSGEIRGEFWDLGRLDAGDGRFSAYDFQGMLEIATRGRWPARGEVFVILGAVMVDATRPAAPSLRAIAMAPDRYADREVTVVGRFRGRNLYGDLPGPLNKSRWDFVIQSADAAVWTTGMQPRGDGFSLDPGRRVDTGKWLSVTGTVRTEGPAVWIEAASIALSDAPEETAVEIETAPVTKPPPPAVVFSAPIAEETGVDRTEPVRIQFSWDMDGDSFKDRVRVSYAPRQQGPPPDPPQLTATYNQGNRGLIIRFAEPLAPFQTVRVELLEGIVAIDGQALEPWSLTFYTGS